ncbi:helix-turn-helix transcriptional regulator [Pseudomonas sp. MWU13-2100]|uniref:helix-turn-helix transcriptional regulator n=1 Tax=Pseudomonas sp. MWU13-2100 TaxID=2935075 RepID=UPI00200D6CA1|nr:AraC family transcriptional regulator [Pseudomonas sp. MWU13-2100]
MSSSSRVRTYGMQQRSDRPDFYIRDKQARPAIVTPHRHDYFQIQINLGGDTVQHIGGAIRPYPHQALAFILPHRLHLIPHPEDGNFVLINFSQAFFLPHLQCDPLDLEDLSIHDLPELSPFQYQEHLDFILADHDFAEVLGLLEKMRELDQGRDLGTRQALKGCLLQLTGKVCSLYASELQALSANKAAHRGRRDALARVSSYLREHIADPALNLKDTAEAAFLSPNYLTHLLRKETGSTFSELVLERRMRLARTHLLNSEKPVSQIAQLCGFADEAYFSRRFKATQGLPPGQFRRRRQEHGSN